VDILGYVFDEGEYFAAESFRSSSSRMYQTIAGDLSTYLFDRMEKLAESDDTDQSRWKLDDKSDIN
jgi:hypothetical protein